MRANLVAKFCLESLKVIENPEPYQDFFNALEKAMFLTAHQVE